MSVFCSKCGKRTYNEYTCDYCLHEIKPSNYRPKKSLNININMIMIVNMIMTVSIAVTTISGLFLAVSKLTEDAPQEKALKALYVTSDMEEIKTMKNQ